MMTVESFSLLVEQVLPNEVVSWGVVQPQTPVLLNV